MTDCLFCGQKPRAFTLFYGINADQLEQPRLPILKCEQCGFVFTDRQKIKEGSAELYFEGYYGETKREGLINRIAVGIFQKERQNISFSSQLPKNALDVGCGDGLFLRRLPEGIARFGFEPSMAGQKSLAAQGIASFDIFRPEPGVTFDLITLWHSLEHIQEPDPTLQALKKLIGPNGRIFISVPNLGSLQARLFYGRWFHLDPTRHLYHFTRESLKRLMDRNGFEIVSWSTRTLEYGVFGWWQSFFNLLPFDFNMGYKILKGRKKYAPTLRNKLGLLSYLFLGLPIATLSLGLMLLETLFGLGAAIHVHVKTKS